ncbi:MAG: DUF3568 family protein [Candidatus Omnitrophota bacterium]
MKKLAAYLLMIGFLGVFISGCAALVVGGAVGALGGYAISKDTIQSDTDTPYERIWDSALEVARMRGVIEEEDAPRGYLKAKIDNSEVWIRLARLTRATTRIRVSARRYHLPNLGLAEDLFVRIMEGAK